MNTLLTVLIAIGLFTYLVIIRGFVLVKLWLWLIVPTFGLTVLSLPAAIGVSLVVGFLTSELKTAPDKEEATAFGLVLILINPFLSLLFGYIISLFLLV